MFYSQFAKQEMKYKFKTSKNMKPSLKKFIIMETKPIKKQLTLFHLTNYRS